MKDWTMLVYLAGDNNLGEEMVWALQEMRKTLETDEVTREDEQTPLRIFEVVGVVAQYDASGTSPKLFSLNKNLPASSSKVNPKNLKGPRSDMDVADGQLATLNPTELLCSFLSTIEPLPEQLAIARLQLRFRKLRPILDDLPVGGGSENRMSLMISILTKAIELERDAPAEKENRMQDWLRELDIDIRKIGSKGLGILALESWDSKEIWGEASCEERSLAALIARSPTQVARSAQARSFDVFIEKQLEVMRQLRTETTAKQHLVVLSGHGSGAVGDFLPDGDPLGSLSIPGLGRLLRNAARAMAEFSPKASDDRHNVDILGLDSCLMSMVEVCSEVRDSVRILIGSEGFVANTGWPYHRVIQKLARAGGKGTNKEATEVARSIVDCYITFYRDYELAGSSTHIAAVDIGDYKFEKLLDHIRTLGDEFLAVLKPVLDELDSEQARDELASPQNGGGYSFGVRDGQARRLLTAMLVAHWRSQTYKMGQYVDIWDFCTNLKHELDETEYRTIRATLTEVSKSIQGLNGVVIASNYCGPDFQHSHGLSVYFPWSLNDLAPEYRNLKFSQESHWFEFLETFLTLTQRERRGEDKANRNWMPFKYGTDAEAVVEDLLLPPMGKQQRRRRKAKDGLHAAVRTGLHAAVRAGVHGDSRAGVHGDSRFGADGARLGIHGDARGLLGGRVFEAVFQNAPNGYFRCELDDEGNEAYKGEFEVNQRATDAEAAQ